VSVVSVLGLLLVLSPRAMAEGEQAEAVQEESASVESRRKAEERRDEVQAFASKLKEAKTPEERRALIDQFRLKMMPSADQSPAARKTEQSSGRSLAELKQKFAGDPEMKERLVAIEARLKAIQELKSAMDAVAKADPKDRPRLLEEASKRRSELMKVQEASFTAARTVSTESEARQIPPQMAALREKSEQRKREIEAFKEALTKASPEERTKLLEEWRAKRQEEMNRQLAEMPR